MAPDDRDRNFEKALARHLRSSASPSTDANVLGGAPQNDRKNSVPMPKFLRPITMARSPPRNAISGSSTS